MNQKKLKSGIIHLPLLIIPAIIIIIGGLYFANKKLNIPTKENIEQGRSTSGFKDLIEKGKLSTSSKDDQEEASPTTIPTTTNTTTPTNTPTPVTQPSTSGPYDLSSVTGALKVIVSASSGSVVGDQLVELLAQDGYKVLVNQSTDKERKIIRQGSQNVDFPQVPAGPYSVRIQYKGQWTGYKSVSVSSAQLSQITFFVVGVTPTPVPVPTPKPKPTCGNPIIYDNDAKVITYTGTTPFNAMFQPQGWSGEAGAIQGYEWKYASNSSWDSSFGLNPSFHTYDIPGVYIVSLRVRATNGEYSDACQSTLTIW